jgi:hypothetical protein
MSYPDKFEELKGTVVFGLETMGGEEIQIRIETLLEHPSMVYSTRVYVAEEVLKKSLQPATGSSGLCWVRLDLPETHRPSPEEARLHAVHFLRERFP